MRYASLLPPLLGLLVPMAWAASGSGDNCPCGYATEQTTYTDLMETDFTTIQDMYVPKNGWAVQEWERAANDETPWAQNATRKNVRPSKDGLQIFVTKDVAAHKVLRGEMATARADLAFGTYRVGFKATNISGTCGAFFWYYNDTQEIDIEFLSNEIAKNATDKSKVNLVIHSQEAFAAHYDASKTPTFAKMPLDYNPTTEFHEYRMDYFPDRVDFYIDNLRMKTMTQNIPTEPGRIFINHWSGGNPGWGGGPPAQDASISILYFKGYFNSSDATRQKQLAAKCDKANARTTCKVPDAVLPMSKGAQVFLSSDKRNVVGQETYGLKFGAAGRLRVERGWVVVVAVASAVWLLSS